MGYGGIGSTPPPRGGKPWPDDSMPVILENLPIPCFFVMVDGIKRTLLVLNDLKKKGMIIDYAIGGGMGIVKWKNLQDEK